MVKRVVTLAVVLALLAAPVASAKLNVRFERPSATVGQTIGVHAIGFGRTTHGPWRVYLVRGPLLASAIYPPYGGGFRFVPPRDVRLYALGRVSRLEGRHRFRLRAVPPGRYALVAWCVGCGDVPPVASYFQGVPDSAHVRWRGQFLTVRR